LQMFPHPIGDDPTAVLRDKDQMGVERMDDLSTLTK